MRKITKETRLKMLEIKQNKNGSIFEQSGIKITADTHQYILNMTGYYTTFHTTLASLFEEVYERREKENLLKSKDKSIEGILKNITKTQRWMKRILKPLDGIKIEDVDTY